ncbi:hypothetical protein Lal_00013766 [Lupinus albus]|nr:hypothetical protein Lal_00013766 [Lupinus albus]
MQYINFKKLFRLLEERRLLFPPPQMSHHKHHLLSLFSIIAHKRHQTQRFKQGIIKNNIELPPNLSHVIGVAPPQRRNFHSPTSGPHDLFVGVRVELEIRNHVRKVRDGDITSKGGSGDDSDDPSAGTKLEYFQWAVIRGGACGGEGGGERTLGRVEAVEVEEGNESGGGWPELERKTLRRELANHNR